MTPSLPTGGSAVMASRTAAPPDALDYFPRRLGRRGLGGELISQLDPGEWSCWEPACGEGHMAHGLLDYFATVHTSDIYDYGYGDRRTSWDFTGPGLWPLPVDWIATNPPFKSGEAFVRAAWPRAQRGVAMLLRLAFLEGAARHRLLYQDCPLTAVAPFAERVPMVKGRWDPDASSATAYAWFIWLKPGVTGADERCRLMPIAPGTKARLSRPSDLAFAVKADAPLLDGARP